MVTSLMTVLSAVAMMFWMSAEVTLIALVLLAITNVTVLYPLREAAKKFRLVRYKVRSKLGLQVTVQKLNFFVVAGLSCRLVEGNAFGRVIK